MSGYVAIALGNLPGGSSSYATAATNGGTFVAGASNDSGGNTQAVYWDAARSVHVLPALTANPTNTQAFDVTGAGRLFVGVSSDPTVVGGMWQPVFWAAPAYAPTRLQLLPGHNAGLALACSGDGGTIVGITGIGSSAPDTFFELAGVVWVNGGAPTALPVPAGAQGEALNISTDGTVIVGLINTSDGTWQPVLWTGGPHWSINILETQPGGVFPTGTGNNSDLAVSAGGSVSFGYTGDALGNIYASTWRGAALTVLPGSIGGINSSVSGCDATGTFASGRSASGEAALWINGTGLLLPSIGGAAGSGGTTVSPDATAIAGYGNAANTAVLWLWQGPPIPGVGGPPTDGSGPTPTPIPIFPVRFLLCEPTDWTLTQQVQTVYGLDHLAGMYVIGLADGVLVGPMLVSSDGAVTLPFPASAVTLGLSFQPQVQTTDLDTGNPTIQARRKDVLAVTARVKSSLGVQVGANQPDGAAQDPPVNAPAWSGMQTIPPPPQAPAYTSPSGQTVYLPVTGDLRANILADWDVRGQIAIQGTPGQPLYVLACIPEVLEGDVIETGYGKEPAAQRRERPAKEGRPVPGRWMLSNE